MFLFNVFRIPVVVSCFWLFFGNTGLGHSETLKAAQRLTNGQVLLHAGGCVQCHTDYSNNGALLAGGKKIKTPFGTFYSPNITADKTYGIGKWSDEDFVVAMRKGISPDSRHYFPAFPYTSFTFLREKDIKAMKDYIFSLPSSPEPNKPHDVTFPFNIRLGQVLWKFLYLTEGPFQLNPKESNEWNRGAYLARAVTHCGECHTRRDVIGGIEKKFWYAGVPRGTAEGGEGVPNITPHSVNGIGTWSLDQIATYLETGEDPQGDFAGSSMADVIENGTSKLSAIDRKAIAVYLKTIKPLP